MSPEAGADRDDRNEKIRIPLWIHQVVEYLLALLIVSQSITAGKAATYLAVTGGLLFVLAAATNAPAGAVRWIPPQLHRVLDLVVIVALLVAPIVSGSTELVAWVLCVLAAVALAWINWHTSWRRAPRPTDRARREPTVPEPVDAKSVESKPTPPAKPAAPTKAASLGDSARALGETVDRTTRGASRAAGRIYGRSRARRADGKEKPEDTA